jgi:hypothetical protein
MAMKKPFSPAAQRNQQAILEVLQDYIDSSVTNLLEFGAGTGQHAVYMAPFFSETTWVVSDIAGKHAGIRMWLKENPAANIEGPIAFKVGSHPFPTDRWYQAFYTANTFHIMPWKKVKTLIKMLGHRLREGSKVFIYGPFRDGSDYRGQSNVDFDQALKQQDPAMGIRDENDVIQTMFKQGFDLLENRAMPANNRILVFERLEHISDHLKA